MSPVPTTTAAPFLAFVLAMVLATLLQGCAEKVNDPQASYDLMKEITFTSVTEGRGRYRRDKVDEYTITGTGVVVGDKYLTVDHVVSQYEKVIHFGMSTSRIAYTDREERTFLTDGPRRIPLQEVINDRGLDIAVFRIPAEHCPNVCNELDAADLYTARPPLGAEVMFIGYPAKIGHYYREARFAGMVEKGKRYNGHELPVEAIAIFPSLITGDSGSGLFDKDTGRLMGINYYNVQTLGLAKPIAVFQPYLGPSTDVVMSGAGSR